jgi:uncharacterized glyoxalase superfamily protein PhnB
MPTTPASTEVTMYPFLRYQDAPAAISWLVQAFGLEARAVHAGPDHTIAHAEICYGGSCLMLGSAKQDDLGLKTARELGAVSQGIYVYVPDPDAHYARAKAAGAEVVYEPRDTEYSSREYGARDLEGNLWSFGTYRPGAAAA